MLQTKLHRPPLSFEHVFRFRLIDELNKNMYKPFSLVCAPAGYGKSMLVSSWLEESKHPTAWLSLSSDENDFRAFVLYFIASIQKIFPEKLQKIESLVNAPELPASKIIAHTLINELDQIQENFIVVLDDYHLIHNDNVHQLMDELLRYPPENLHVCILTRRDPPLRIKTLRAHNRMIEIRMDDLTFTEEEIIGLFKKLHGITLEPSTVASLQTKTEGWITALQLVSLASKNKSNIEKELAAFTGDLNTLSDFLIEEILSGLSNDLKELLFCTVLFERFSLELITASCMVIKNDTFDVSKTETLFDQLIHSNLFLIPLDDEQKWFRYHHLFQKILLDRFYKTGSTAVINEIHESAGSWFAENYFVEEAIKHKLAAKNPEAACKIIEQHRMDQLDADNWVIVKKWIDLIPAEQQVAGASFLLAEAWIAYETFQLEKVLQLTARVLDDLDENENNFLLIGESLLLAGMVNYWLGNGEISLQHFKEASIFLSNGDYKLLKGMLFLHQALANSTMGKKGQAIEDLNKQLAKNTENPIYVTRLLSGIHYVNHSAANLSPAIYGAQRSQKLAQTNKLVYTRTMNICMVGAAQYNAFNLKSSQELFEQVYEFRFSLHKGTALDALAAKTISHEFLGQYKEADISLKELYEFELFNNDTAHAPISASCEVQLSLLRGKLSSASEWEKTMTDKPIYATMFVWVHVPVLIQIKVLIAKGDNTSLLKASSLVDTYISVSEKYHLTNQLIPALVLKSLIFKKQQDIERAIEVVFQAVILARPGKFIRPFIEEGFEMKMLLDKLKASVILAEKHGFNIPSAEAGKSATVFLNSVKGKGVALEFIDEIDRIVAKVARKQDTALHEKIEVSEKVALTERELETLELLATGLRNKEIANTLFVSESTIKRHVYNMCQKFNTKSRVHLINKARTLAYIE